MGDETPAERVFLAEREIELADGTSVEGDVAWEGEFIEVRAITSDPWSRESPYEYLHESRSGGEVVAVLPFEVGPDGAVERFLLRVEVCPAWGPDEVRCALTGGVETDRPVEDAVRELREESGYDVGESDMVSLGGCRGTKSTDTVYHLFGVDVTGVERGSPEGDGSFAEEMGSVEWTDSIVDSPDPHVHVMWSRLFHMFRTASRRG